MSGIAEGLARNMKKRSKVWAILGSAVLTLGVVGIALAVDLKDAHQGLTISFENGSIVVMDGETDVTDQFVIDCGPSYVDGNTEIHFVQSPTDDNDALLDVDFSDDAQDVADMPQDGNQGSQLDWDVPLDVSGGAVTLIMASTDADGGELRVSHICDSTTTETPPPSFEESEAGETDVPTDEPSFEESQEGETDAPSEPQTDALGGNGTSAPADGAWLLVVALGVLLGSIVVLTPARAKSRR
jgi:hypothetical protein